MISTPAAEHLACCSMQDAKGGCKPKSPPRRGSTGGFRTLGQLAQGNGKHLTASQSDLLLCSMANSSSEGRAPDAYCQHTVHASKIQQWGWDGISQQPGREGEESGHFQGKLHPLLQSSAVFKETCGVSLLSLQKSGQAQDEAKSGFSVSYWWLRGKAFVQEMEIN